MSGLATRLSIPNVKYVRKFYIRILMRPKASNPPIVVATGN